MGYMLAYGFCFSCKHPFSFNPHYVPSLRWEGERQPICRHCIDLANVTRKANGIAPHVIHPNAFEPESDDDEDRLY